ncbi:hypothetical protein CHH55_20650 [Niallia circulans]|jgi:hypothetical protein|uniref:hypothetical protein n=1 Tax=Niallia circulans TaxID=1397 RepID=UPI000BA78066|nr:hypothetical protein [Niallia circulans]PAD23675.1 hypothetical protein CHH62_21290 [Niallia circulans]PAD85949.1 hypothetical protein CHH55_20650 [Niallia circulans]
MLYAKKIMATLLSLVLLLGIFPTIYSPVFASENDSVQSNENVTDNKESLEPIQPEEIKFDINKNLSEEQISDRFEEINSSYEVNQPFSIEDIEFIRAYATPNNSNTTNNPGMIQTQAIKLGNHNSAKFNKPKTKYGVTVKFSGTVYTDINVLNHSYRGNITAKITAGSSKVKKIKLATTNKAYGLLGKGGTYVGIVNSSEVSSSTTTKNTGWSMDKTGKYGAVGVLYTYTDAYVDITTTSGAFNLYAF